MAATAVPDTGHGASITFATTAGTWKVRSLRMGGKSFPTVSTTYMATTTMHTVMVGDLAEWENPVATVLFQGTQGVPTGGASETITITLPIPGGSASTAPSLAGTGIIMRVKYPDLATNELQIGEIEWKWDGSTPPAWTAAT